MDRYERELALLLSMTKEERDVHILTEAVEDETAWYDRITEEWRQNKSMAPLRKEHAERVRYWKARLNAAKAKLGKNG